MPTRGGLALGAYQSSTALSRILGPLVAGQLYQGLGHRGPYWVGGIGLLITALVALRLRRSDPA